MKQQEFHIFNFFLNLGKYCTVYVYCCGFRELSYWLPFGTVRCTRDAVSLLEVKQSEGDLCTKEIVLAIQKSYKWRRRLPTTAFPCLTNIKNLEEEEIGKVMKKCKKNSLHILIICLYGLRLLGEC